MKTLVRPQVKTTIAISSNQKYKKDLEIVKLTCKSTKKFFCVRNIILFLSVFIFTLVPESPEFHSDLCNKYNSQQTCNVW